MEGEKLENSLSPEKIYNDLITHRIKKNDAIELFTLIIEESNDISAITSTIKIISSLSFKSKRLFKLLENLLISDEEVNVRSSAAKALINNYIEELITPMKWTIEHEKSTIVLKALFDSFENVSNKYTKMLKKELLLSIFGVVEEEIQFFLDLDAICEEFREMNISFYKDYQTNDINEVRRGKGIYAVIDGHVVALNLTGWALNMNSFFSKSQPISHKKLLNISKLPNSLGDLKYLEFLDLSYCTYLQSLPKSIIELKLLKELNLSNCIYLNQLPENIDQLQSLEILNLAGNYILEKLPVNIGYLLELKELKLCSRITTLPYTIGNLKNLEKLILSDCTFLKILPESIGELESLKELDLSYCVNLKSLPESLRNLKSLKKLNIVECRFLEKLPENLNDSKSLEIIRKEESSLWR